MLHLHPSRRRQHRLSGQHRLRCDGRDPGHRSTFQRPAGRLIKALEGGAICQRWRGVGRHEQRWVHRPRRRPDAADGARYATFAKGHVLSPVTDARESRNLWWRLRTRPAGTADQRGDQPLQITAELSTRNLELRAPHRQCLSRRRDHDATGDRPRARPDGAMNTSRCHHLSRGCALFTLCVCTILAFAARNRRRRHPVAIRLHLPGWSHRVAAGQSGREQRVVRGHRAGGQWRLRRWRPSARRFGKRPLRRRAPGWRRGRRRRRSSLSRSCSAGTAVSSK